MSETEVLRTGYDGATPVREIRPLAAEAPVAIEVNGVAHAVMMASPVDLEDFATGFALSEGMVEAASEIEAIAISQVERGWIVRITLPAQRAAPMLERVRVRVAEGSCGLCGLESIEQVLRPLPKVQTGFRTSPAAIRHAIDALPEFQPEGLRTGAMHVAAFCSSQGKILAAREDIGRHNALDKLLGALARAGTDPASGFVLVSARCSYELVEKAARAGCPLLVAISAASDLALKRAREAGMALVGLARHDNMLVMTDPQGTIAETVDGI